MLFKCKALCLLKSFPSLSSLRGYIYTWSFASSIGYSYKKNDNYLPTTFFLHFLKNTQFLNFFLLNSIASYIILHMSTSVFKLLRELTEYCINDFFTPKCDRAIIHQPTIFFFAFVEKYTILNLFFFC